MSDSHGHGGGHEGGGGHGDMSRREFMLVGATAMAKEIFNPEKFMAFAGGLTGMFMGFLTAPFKRGGGGGGGGHGGGHGGGGHH